MPSSPREDLSADAADEGDVRRVRQAHLGMAVEHDALATLIMIPYSLDEVVARGQFLVANTCRGRRFWRSFFMGDALPGSGREKRPGFGPSMRDMVASAMRGVTVPWTLVASAVLGAWLMFSRLIFGTQPSMADSDHLIGALVITVAAPWPRSRGPCASSTCCSASGSSSRHGCCPAPRRSAPGPGSSWASR